MPKRNPFAEIWDGMTELGRRLVALEKAQLPITVGSPYRVAPADADKLVAREIKIGNVSIRVVTIENETQDAGDQP